MKMKVGDVYHIKMDYVDEVMFCFKIEPWDEHQNVNHLCRASVATGNISLSDFWDVRDSYVNENESCFTKIETFDDFVPLIQSVLNNC